MSFENTDSGYVSIQIEVLVEVSLIDDAGLEDALAGFEQRAGSVGLSSEIEYHSDEFAPALRKIRNQHPEIAAWIDFQQHALSALALQVNSQRAMLATTQPQNVSISAAGMEFNSDVDCVAGNHLEIILSLGTGLPTILTIGVVDKMAEVDQVLAQGSENKKLQVQFTHIREADQEVLIRHIHRTQLNQIRSARASRSTVA